MTDPVKLKKEIIADLKSVNKLQKLVTAIRIISKNKPVVLLDDNTNPDVDNLKSPLSHASLIKAYIEGNYPEWHQASFPIR